MRAEVSPDSTRGRCRSVVLLMLGAGVPHQRRGELGILPVNLTLAALALFVAIERFGPHSL